MSFAGGASPIHRLLVVMPTWLGDCVMATPTLRALRERFAEAHITALLRADVVPLMEHLPSIDAFLTVGGKRRLGTFALVGQLARGRFDAAVLLPNSFRSALRVYLAGIPRRIGYDRDSRGFMLTDRLLPRRNDSGFLPVPTVEYYLGLAAYLGASDCSWQMQLATTEEDDAHARALLQKLLSGEADRPLVLLNPGAQKLVKRWPAERFAALADALEQDHGVAVAVTGSPAEQPVLDQVCAAAKSPVINLANYGVSLRLLKSVVKLSSLMVTNDTGPRHVAAAVGTPVVTLFGPTDPAWTEIRFDRERQVIAPDITDPTPEDREHFISAPRRMDHIPVEQVVAAASQLLTLQRSGADR